VLISVQHAPLLEQIREFLRRAGHAVMVAVSAEDALQLLGGPWCNIDLLLAETPLRDAAELAREAVSRRPGVRVLLISGEPEYINRELMPELEIGFIEKPFAWRDLSEAIARLLSDGAAARNCPPAALAVSFTS
jgi:DNA-binding response OmpR family regulator